MSTVTRHILSDEILDKIMILFWESGYSNVSIDDLIKVTGFNRAALYKNFGGKHGLFVAMLYRFRDKVVVEATRPISDPANGIDGIVQFFRQFSQQDLHQMSSRGCFMIATASNLPVHDAEVAAVIEEFINHLRGLFGKCMRYMQAEQRLSSDVEVEVVADFLVGSLVGLMTLIRSNVDQRMLNNHIKGILAFLASLPARRESFRGTLHLVS